ncbi:hypothetical protein BC940DRAFT_367529 [Gongronella butleri]|nr:hypothetical protein BC940DRAFT_367529 [Gongronella butleri]
MDKAAQEQVADQVDQVDVDQTAKAWIQEQMDTEVNRIRTVGTSVIPVGIKNCGILPNFDQRKARAINRIELDTNFNVNKVEQVMVSAPVEYPHKENFFFVHVVLVTSSPIPLLVPYLYQAGLKVTQPERVDGDRKIPSKEVVLKNDLKEFLFINKQGIRGRFSIHEYHDFAYNEITVEEKALLQQQFDASPYCQQKNSRPLPTKLAVFDYDSTLFLSPSLSPSLWHSKLVNALTDEDGIGPGWWKDRRSLDLGPEVAADGWRGYWNEDMVSQARDCLKDKNTLTVILTGRRAIPFQPMIEAMTAAQGLAFDLYGLRPDPSVDTQQDHTSNTSSKHHTLYGAPSVFRNTLDFKSAFLLNLLHNLPSIRDITMWDDRAHHVKRFTDYLDRLKRIDLIDKLAVLYVPPIRPRFRPMWEHAVVADMLTRHHDNVKLFHKTQQWNRAVQSVNWDMVERKEHEKDEKNEKLLDELVALQANSSTAFPPAITAVSPRNNANSTHLLPLSNNNDEMATTTIHTHATHMHMNLRPMASATVFQLDDASMQSLRNLLEPICRDWIAKKTASIPQEGNWREKAEQAIWYGHQVFVHDAPIEPRHAKGTLGIKIGTNAKLTVTHLSAPHPEHGVSALVKLHGLEPDRRPMLLPLMYCPSAEDALWGAQHKMKWQRPPQTLDNWHGHATLTYSYRLGLESYRRALPKITYKQKNNSRKRHRP